MEKVKESAFLVERDMKSLKELLEKTKQQVEEKEMEIQSLKETIKAARQQVEDKEMTLELLKKSIKEVKQQVEEKEMQLYPTRVKQFAAQCLMRLETAEYDAGYRLGTSVAVLYRLHEVWCEIRGIRYMTQKAFTREMQSLGYYKDKGTCLVKSCAAGQAKDKQQIIYHYVPKIEDISLQKQVRKKIHEKLTEGYWNLSPAEYQQLYALFVWFDV